MKPATDQKDATVLPSQAHKNFFNIAVADPLDRYYKGMRRFHLVDFAAHFQKGFRNHVVSIREVPRLVESFDRYGCYTTCFFYSDEILTYMSAHAVGSTPTIAGYEGRVWASRFPIDLDHPDLGVSLQSARFFLSFLIDGWRADPNAIQIYFSGSKGFHLMLDTRLFGRIVPSKSLPLVFASMRRHLAQELPKSLRETVDLGIKDRVRLLRLPNTIHEKSKLYKVMVLPEELKTFGPDQIRDLAREPRPLRLTDETGYISRVSVQENREASRLFKRLSRQVRRITRKPFAYRFHRPEDLTQIIFPCAGVQKIWESHVEPGFRNNCAIRLASELRLLGLTEEEAGMKLFEWNEKNSIDLPSHELQNVVRSAYQHRFPYRYSCRDEILRRFCPLPDYEACEARILSHSERQ